MKAMSWLTVLALLALLLTSACPVHRGQVRPGPGETPDDLAAAGEGLAAVAGSVPLVVVRVSDGAGAEERRTVGVIVGDDGRVLVDAAALGLPEEAGERPGSERPRTVEAIFHPGGDNEWRSPAELVRENDQRGLALLSMERRGGPAVPLGDDLADGAPVFLISSPASISRIIAEMGTVRGYVATDAGRFLTHTAGHDPGATGPIFDERGALVGLQVSAAPDVRMAIPSVTIAGWLQAPARHESPGAGQVLGGLLQEMDVDVRIHRSGGAYVMPRPSERDLLLSEREGRISVEVDLGTLHVGDAIEALRSNYSDPLGAYALKPVDGSDRLVWVARIPADVANTPYLDYATRIAVIQAARWPRIVAGLEPEYPYEYYPDGDEEALQSRLAEIIGQAAIAHETTGLQHRIDPEANVPVFARVFEGMAYVYAYAGGIPGDRASAREQIARELLRRNWQMPLGRLALDSHFDLAWEAQVPVEHLTPDYLAALVRVCQDEIARIVETHGQIPFNE